MLAPIVMPTNKAPEHAEPKIRAAIASFLAGNTSSIMLKDRNS
jgi:hypothetical protein